MEFKFIAVNGDNVGDSIGSAIATDNHEELSKITGGLKDAHGAIEQWIESVGGEIVTSSGDEGIYKIPAESFDEATIDGLREQYSQSTCTTITVGVGASMSEASKALIYGKLNDKDQVVEYDPHIDDYIAGHDEEVVDDEEVPEHEQHLDEEGKAIHDATETETDEEEIHEEDMAQVGEAAMAGEVPAQDPEYQEEVPEMDETALNGESAIGETDEALPDSEQEIPMQAEQEISAEGGELGIAPEDETLVQQGELGDEELNVAPEAKLDEVMGQDLDGDGDIDTMTPDEAQLPEGSDVNPEGEMGDENQSALTDMIHANMGEEGMEEGEEGADDEELRQDIANSLITFKENKAMLEQAKEQNPKLYEATILMLRSMIEMAKKLNMNPEADVEGQMAQEGLPEAGMADAMAAEEGEEGPIPEPEDEAVAQEKESDDAEALQEVEGDAIEDEKQKNPFGKGEIVKLYSSLMKGCATLDKADKQYWRKELAEKERRAKEARRPKKNKGTTKGKQVRNQKPVDAAIAEIDRKMRLKKESNSEKKQ